MFTLGMVAALILVPTQLRAQATSTVDHCYLSAINDVLLRADDIGKLLEVAVNDGDSIQTDDLIAQIDDQDAVMAKAVAVHKYNAARKKATNDVSVKAAVAGERVTKASYDNILQANTKQPNAYTEMEVMRAKFDWERSGLQIELAQHEMDVAVDEANAALAEYKQAERMIQRRKLMAPFSGVVDQVILEPGEWVGAGDPVVHLVQMDRLRVHGRIPAELYAPKDVTGRPVEVTVNLAGGGTHVVNGEIGFASNVVDDDGAFRVWAEIENPRVGNSWLLGPGLAAEMKLR
jgi:macrolide-specific efflux system membrane fusion protein